jgi:hypothetical protein
MRCASAAAAIIRHRVKKKMTTAHVLNFVALLAFLTRDQE